MAAANEESRAGAARRVDRGVRHRDRHKMDQCQSEADRDTRKTGRRALGGGADDDEQKKERHHHFHQKTVMSRQPGSLRSSRSDSVLAWSISRIAAIASRRRSSSMRFGF